MVPDYLVVEPDMINKIVNHLTILYNSTAPFLRAVVGTGAL